MNLETLREYCLRKKGSDEAFPFGEGTLVLRVAGKMFALIAIDSVPLTINLKCEPELAVDLRDRYDTFGRVDGCFANAGIGGGGRHAFVDRTEEQWRTMFATNLDGVFHVLQAAARHMTERANAGDAFGRLVATSSLASLFGTARNEHYAATKAAINALVRALAVELARHGITSNAILPGWIKSEMTAGIMANDKFVANVMPRIPMRRFGEPGDFGGIAVYLMSKASSYHTADTFVIDGGYTAF